MPRPVFLPTEFKLLRRACKRYSDKMPEHTAAPGQECPISTEAKSSYSAAHGVTIGTGCFRTLPVFRAR